MENSFWNIQDDLFFFFNYSEQNVKIPEQNPPADFPTMQQHHQG